MAKWTLASYNRFIGESMTRYGLTRKQAAQHYREMHARLDRPAFRTDLRHHPRLAKQGAERAFALRPPVKRKKLLVEYERKVRITKKLLKEFEDDEEITFSEESPGELI